VGALLIFSLDFAGKKRRAALKPALLELPGDLPTPLATGVPTADELMMPTADDPPLMMMIPPLMNV